MSDNLPTTQTGSPILDAAMNPDLDVDKMEKLFDLYERDLARKAREAFNRDMSKVQGEMRPIYKDAINPDTSSKYARLESVIIAISPIYTKHGFALSFNTGKSELGDMYILIECEVSHADGYSKTYKYDSPIDDKGRKGTINKTAPHGRSSAVAYGRRYLTAMIFNLAMIGDDKDGNGVNESISIAQQSELRDLMIEKEVDEEKFLKYMKFKSIDLIPKKAYARAIAAVRNKK